MAYDELELDRIGDRKTAVFFIISDTTQTYNFLVALAFSQMFNLLCERADNVHGGRLPHHVRVLWDEAANTGQVPQLEKIVAVIRSREISLTLFYQQLAQCKAIYDKHAETILGNMDSVIFLGGREASTIKEISENWLGKATISMQTDSRSRGQSESYSQNNQRLGRELMTPSELATMPGDKCILQLRGLPPFYSPKYDLKKHPNYRYTAEADKKKNAFDLDRLINRRRRPGPDELCEVYAVAVPDDGLTSEDEDILNYDDIDDPDAFAYAYAGGEGEDYGDPTMETPAPEPTITPGEGFSEEGNLVTRDLLYDEHTNKQFITVQTSGGNTFYIVIDYDKPVDEEGEQYETYFFSIVDEGDLLAAAEAAGVEQAVCSCPEKCAAGAVNTDCPVCSVNMGKCVGAEPEPEPAPEPEPEPEKPGNAGMILLVLAVMGIGGGAAWYFKIYRPKHQQADQPEEDDGEEYQKSTSGRLHR